MSKNNKPSVCQNHRQTLSDRIDNYKKIINRLASFPVKTPMVRKSLNHYQNKVLELNNLLEEF